MDKIELIKHLPPILRKVNELYAICAAEDPEFEKAREAYLSVFINLFVSTAGKDGVSRFEDELGITPDALDTLEVRKKRIIALISGGSVYTMRWLEKWISDIGGTVKPTIEDYTLRVTLPANCDYKTLFDALKVYIPANILLGEGIKLTSSEVSLYTGTAIRFSVKRTIEGNSVEGMFTGQYVCDENGDILTDEIGNILIY